MKIQASSGWKTCIAAAVVVATFGGGSAQAMTQIDFGIIAPTTGVISYAGSATPLIGTGIEIDEVVGLNTPLNNFDVLTIDMGILNFATGNLVSAGPTNWTFDAGGSIEITGKIPAIGINVSEVLLTGNFTSGAVVAVGSLFKVTVGSFLDFKHDDILAHYGLPAGQYEGNINLSFAALGQPSDAFASDVVFSGDIVNTTVVIPTPTSVTMAVLLMMALGCLTVYRLRLRHRQATVSVSPRFVERIR